VESSFVQTKNEGIHEGGAYDRTKNSPFAPYTINEAGDLVALGYCWSPTNNLHNRVEGNYEVNGLRKTNPIAKAEPKVNRVNAFSRSVFAKMLPTVFRANTTTKIQSMMWMTLTGNLYVTKSPFINSIHIKKRLMAMEVVSKTYISWSF